MGERVRTVGWRKGRVKVAKCVVQCLVVAGIERCVPVGEEERACIYVLACGGLCCRIICFIAELQSLFIRASI